MIASYGTHSRKTADPGVRKTLDGSFHGVGNLEGDFAPST